MNPDKDFKKIDKKIKDIKNIVKDTMDIIYIYLSNKKNQKEEKIKKIIILFKKKIMEIENKIKDILSVFVDILIPNYDDIYIYDILNAFLYDFSFFCKNFIKRLQKMDKNEYIKEEDDEEKKEADKPINTGTVINNIAISLSVLNKNLSKKINHLKTAVVTTYTHNYNNTILSKSKDDDILQYQAVLDSRTTTTCRNNNKLKGTKDFFIKNNKVPPLHYNCRSILVKI